MPFIFLNSVPVQRNYGVGVGCDGGREVIGVVPATGGKVHRPRVRVRVRGNAITDGGPGLPSVPTGPDGFAGSFALGRLPGVVAALVRVITSPVPADVLTTGEVCSFTTGLGGGIPVPLEEIPRVGGALKPGQSSGVPVKAYELT